MTIYELRPAIQSEANQIKSLINSVGINPTGLDWRRFVVAIGENGQVIACGQVKPHRGGIRELASIAVHPGYRGKGIARAVIELLLRENQRPMYLMCMSHNRLIYEKFGFQSITGHRLPRYFARVKKLFTIADMFKKSGEELLVMKLE